MTLALAEKTNVERRLKAKAVISGDHQRRLRGRRAHVSGQSAEDVVLRSYKRRGYHLLERRWRGRAGEIDLILEHEDQLVFVEVKTAPDFARAAASLGARQVQRICRAAEEYAGSTAAGSLSEMRIDAGLVNGQGMVEIIENAIGAY